MKSTVRHKCKVCGKVFDGDAVASFARHKKTCVPKDNADILHDTIETLELTIRSARRCAYDLNHAAGDVRDGEMRKIYQERAEFFVKLFQSGNAMKDYRHRLYAQIGDLEYKLEQLRGLLAKHKIDDPTNF